LELQATAAESQPGDGASGKAYFPLNKPSSIASISLFSILFGQPFLLCNFRVVERCAGEKILSAQEESRVISSPMAISCKSSFAS
jgi:hypothetical protein